MVRWIEKKTFEKMMECWMDIKNRWMAGWI